MKAYVDPFTGRLLPKPCPVPFLPSYARVPLYIHMDAASHLTIQAGGAIQIFSRGLGTAQGLVVVDNLTVRSDSSFIVESGGSLTAIGA